MSDCPNCGAPSDGEPCEDCAPPNFALHQSIRQKDDRIRALEAEIAGWWPVKDGLETELRNATSAANAYKDRAEKAEAERDEIVRSRKAFMDGIAAFESMTGFDLENGARRLKDLETADHRVAELEAELSRRVGPGLFELRKDRDMWKARAEKVEAALDAAHLKRAEARVAELQEACESYLRSDEGDLDAAEFMEVVFPNPREGGRESGAKPGNEAVAAGAKPSPVSAAAKPPSRHRSAENQECGQ